MLEPIVCVDNSWGFSRRDEIPWNYKKDITLFSDLTTKKENINKKNICLMGRKTWDGIPLKFRPLKHRINIIVSQTLSINEPDIFTVKTIEEGVKLCLDMYLEQKVERVFVIGGKSLYDYALKSVLLKQVHITQINKYYYCDNYFDKKLLFQKCYNDMTHHINLVENDTELNYYLYKSHQKYEGEEKYLALMWNCINKNNLNFRATRNSNTWSCFGGQLEFDLKKGFPLTTTRKTFLRSIFYELKMFLLGETDTKKWLSDKGIKIWEGNTSREFLDNMNLNNYPVGCMGNMYGFQWSHYGCDYDPSKTEYQGFNQIKYVLDLLKKDKYSRRILLSSYDPSRANQGPLFPCHSLILQFYVENDNELCVHMYQRSADAFLGENFNIASTSLLLILFTIVLNNDPEYKETKFIPGRVIISLGDYHIYESHIEALKIQLSRIPYSYPKINIKKQTNNFADFEFEDIEIIDYNCYPHIQASMIA